MVVFKEPLAQLAHRVNKVLSVLQEVLEYKVLLALKVYLDLLRHKVRLVFKVFKVQEDSKV